MPIPTFQAVMLPLLRDFSKGERTGQDSVDAMAQHFGLAPEELAIRLPSGKQSKFTNRVAWAKSHLKAAGLLESPRRGLYRITPRGRDVLAQAPFEITLNFLDQFPEHVAFRQGTGHEPAEPTVALIGVPERTSVEERTPDDLIDDGYRQLRTALVAELKERIVGMSPAAFEQLVVDLLTAMNYGGPQEDAGIVVGRGGDEGIDGIIKEDRLGLETIYLQAKRWQSTVGRPEIQRFAGALQGQRARKGVFITSSSFSAEALSYARSIQTTIVLIDGAQLAELMIDYGVGVTTAKKLEIKRVDSDYFVVE